MARMVRLVVLYAYGALHAGLKMDNQVDPYLFETGFDASMLDSSRAICHTPASARSAKVALIPLIRTAKTSPPQINYHLLQRLIVTVQLDSAIVHQRWLLDISGDAGVRPSGTMSSLGDARQEAHCKAEAYDSVQYHLPRTTLDEFTDNQGLPRVSTNLDGSLYECPIFTRLSHLILPGVAAPGLFSSHFMDYFVMLFCAHVVHVQQIRPADKIVHRGGLSTSQKRRAIELLSKGICSDVRLAYVAKECGLSVSHFARSFKISFGQPVHRWIIAQRVARAKELLLNTNDPLIEIAFQAGFCDQASFNRTFAKLTGTSPGRWRRDFKE